MKWLLDKRTPDGEFPFKWRGSLNTDIRQTFERARREQQAQQQQNVRSFTSTRARKS